jgi:predicted phage-related endonuclease
MTDRNFDLNSWVDTYQEAFASFTRAQLDAFRALERFARFHYAVAGDVLEASLAHTRAAIGARATVGTQVIAELLQKQAELGTQLSEKLRARAQEFSVIATDAQQSMGAFAADAANRAGGTKKVA